MMPLVYHHLDISRETNLAMNNQQGCFLFAFHAVSGNAGKGPVTAIFRLNMNLLRMCHRLYQNFLTLAVDMKKFVGRKNYVSAVFGDAITGLPADSKNGGNCLNNYCINYDHFVNFLLSHY